MIYRESKMWDPGLFDDPPRQWEVSSVGALLYMGELERTKARRFIDYPKVILVQRKEDLSWSFPAGRPEGTDRTPVDVAAREVFEETGLTVDPSRMVLYTLNEHPNKKGMIRLLYSAKIDGRNFDQTYRGLGKTMYKDGERWTEYDLDPDHPEIVRIALVNLGAIYSRSLGLFTPLFKGEMIYSSIRRL